MDTIAVGVCDSNVVFETGVIACLAEDPTIETIRLNGGDRTSHDLDAAVISIDHIDERWADCPLIVCADPTDASIDISGRNDIAAMLLRSEVTPEQLVGAVHAAAVGLRLTRQTNGSGTLDQRSLHVLALLAEGASTREISLELGFSERTVKSIVSMIGARLGARSRAHAVALAMRQAIIS